MTLAPTSLADRACAILRTAEPCEKAALSFALADDWRSGHVVWAAGAFPPDRPARPAAPQLLAPREMKRRKAGGNQEKKLVLLHALAHIELNAIDLAWDIIARFGGPDTPRSFFDDWIKVAREEAQHFTMVSERLNELGSHYGAFPAHDGLWDAATKTADDLVARLAIVPMILEARGLDVTPSMIADFERSGDEKSAAILKVIYQDEIGHVAIGCRWYRYHTQDTKNPVGYWHELKRLYFRGDLKPPFNGDARRAANFPEEYWNV